MQEELSVAMSPATICRHARRTWPEAMVLDRSPFAEGWGHGTLIGVGATVHTVFRRASLVPQRHPLAQLDSLISRRRQRGGAAQTGVLAVCGYDLLSSPGVAGIDDDGLPELVLIEVDRSLQALGPNRYRSTITPDLAQDQARASHWRRWVEGLLEAAEVEPGPPARLVSPPSTSMPREAYLGTFQRLQDHIAAGDIYQANLCQQFRMATTGDPYETFVQLQQQFPAPHSAYVEWGSQALVSISPETFFRGSWGGSACTWPIKGTRPRGHDEATDRAAAEELCDSTKDRAELLMIVDLERNDLGRICHTGSVRVDPLVALRSFPTVHHLVAQVKGELLPSVGPAALLQATFPGGSITGAPKHRAMEILRALEPRRRNMFTGSLLWFGDDGSFDSSILIRTLVFGERGAFLGAGGGIVADSDPESEWLESNHKARALTQALGFDPEDVR